MGISGQSPTRRYARGSLAYLRTGMMPNAVFARAVQYGRLARDLGGSLCDALERLLALAPIAGPDDSIDRAAARRRGRACRLEQRYCHIS